MTSYAALLKRNKTSKVKQMQLPHADEGVVTRFPPEPSGYLHIGHAKAALLNDHFAHVQYPGGKLILRFDDTNTEKQKEEYQEAIREDVARTGTKYRAYPTYQFACPIVDSLEGVTHALRTTEYNEQDAMYKWILKTLNLRVPFTWTFSKIEFKRALMSKRKLAKLVNTGAVTGWDDPRVPTVRGIRRRGMTIEGLRDFMVSQGPSKNVDNMDWHTIWSMNKQVIDRQASRYTAIDQGYVNCTISVLEVYTEDKPKHAKYDLGKKKVVFGPNIILEQEDAKSLAVGEEVTLMHWGNAVVKDVTSVGEKGEIVSHMIFDLHLEGDFKTTRKKLTWLSIDQRLAPVELVDFDHLLSKDKLTDKDEKKWEEFLTPKTEFRTEAAADCNIWDVQVDDVLQFDRKGYYRCDRAVDHNAPGIFFKIPSGKE